MSRNGQIHSDADNRPLPDAKHPVVGYARDYPKGHVVDWHGHVPAQLLYAASGLLRVETDAGLWVVPPHRAVWIPAGMLHRVRMTTAVEMRTLYVREGLPGLAGGCRVIAVSPLLRELIVAFAVLPPDYALDGPVGRLAAVILDQLRVPASSPLHLPLPQDPRLRRVVAGLFDDPADRRPLSAWARTVGASARTLARLFVAETGMGFAAWRQQHRLHAALARLTAGEAVTSVAFAVGYDSPSAFIAMFRKALGASPQRYLADPGGLPAEGWERKKLP
jgi:AraC family transcriptional regulator, regulator of nimT